MDAPKHLEVISVALASVGFRLLCAEAGSMDSGVAQFSDGSRTLRVIKDRGQWFLDGRREELESVGLWGAFNHTEEFRDAVRAYISRATP